MAPDIVSTQRDLLALCALTAGDTHCDRSLIARHVYRFGNLADIKAGYLTETSPAAHRTRWVLMVAHPSDWEKAYAKADSELAAAAASGAKLTTVLDSDYPLNLCFVYNLPPFLFYRGSLRPDRDARSLAVVGTRRASRDGLAQAHRLAAELVQHGITVTSGLASGIDTAAHRATLAAGGRTIAVSPVGITGVYPAKNRALSEEIEQNGGLVVSPFFATSGVDRARFRRRNVVTSGISQGTVVVEAGWRSGARMQARVACEHDRQVFLLSGLAGRTEWAAEMLRNREAKLIDGAGCVRRWVADPRRLREAREAMRIDPALI